MADFPAGGAGTHALASERIGFAGFPFSGLINEPSLRTSEDGEDAVQGDPTNNPVDPEVVQPGNDAGAAACPDGVQSYGPDWFERFHVFPRGVFEFGQIVSDVTLPFELYSAFRTTTQTLTSIQNNVQPGVELPGFPSTPYAHPPLTSVLSVVGFPAGSSLTPVVELLNILATELGLPSFDSTIVFDYGAIEVSIALTGSRTSLIVPDYERGFTEVLRYGTVRPTAISGKTKRVSLRPTSAQTEYQLRFRNDGLEQRIIAAQLYDGQTVPLALPLRHWRKKSTAAVSAGTDTIQVDTTNAEFRVGGQAAVISGVRVTDVLVIQSLTASSITFESPLSNDHPVGADVMPSRLGFLPARFQTAVWRVQLREIVVSLHMVDDAVGAFAGDASSFPTFNGRVLFDDDNIMLTPNIQLVQERRMQTVRNVWTNPTQSSSWPQARESFPVVVSPKTREQHIRYRRFFDFTRGGQVAFYMTSKFEELIPTRDLTDTTTALYVENIGFARFLKAGPTRSIIRLTRTDGSQVIRTITTGVVESDTEELLTIDSPWTQTDAPEDIERIEWVWLVTISSDAIRIQHQDLGKARIEFAVQTEFDDQ